MNQLTQPLNSKLRGGVLPAMATPLHADGLSVNEAAVGDLVNFLLARGVTGLFVGGTTGEGLLLAPAQRQRLHEAAVDAVGGRAPLLLHVGADTAETAVALARHAADLGADALAAVTPTYYLLPDEGLLAYYEAIAEAAPDLPLFAYDIPHMAVNGISPGLLVRLAQRIDNFAGLKSSRIDAQVVRQQIDATPEGKLVLAGNERIALGLLALGADGLISGLATAVPEPLVELTAAYCRGDLEGARRAQRRVNQILDTIPGQSRIGVLKRILEERGVAVGPAVPPRLTPEGAIWPNIKEMVDNSR